MANLVNSIIEISLVSSVFIAVLLFISPLLGRKYTARSLCIVWLVLALRLLIPITYHFQQPVVSVPISVPSISINYSITPDADLSEQTMMMLPSDVAAKKSIIHSDKVSAYYILSFAWAIGMLLYMAIRFSGYYLLRKKIQRFSKPITDEKVLQILSDTMKKLNIRDGNVTVKKYCMAQGPMIIGFIHPVILISDDFTKDLGELELVFMHELLHYKHKHLWFKLILAFGNAIHWFNPLAYIMVHEANKQMENVCDQEIVSGKDLQTRKKYSESILAAMTREYTKRAGLTAYFYGDKKTMKQRFENIFDQRIKKRGVSIVASALLIMLLSSTLVACQAGVGADPALSAPETDTGTNNTASETSSGADDEIDSITSDWYEAVKSGDDAAEYNLMTTEFKKTIDAGYDCLNWLSGNPNIKINDFTYTEITGGIRITFCYTDINCDSKNKWDQYITCKEENGKLKIDSITDLASVTHAWAKAVRDHDGKAQYALMTQELQNTVYNEFESLDWITGASDPGVRDYFGMDNNCGGFRITFRYKTSTGAAGGYYQDLTFKEEDGRLKIDSASDPVELPDVDVDTSLM